MERPRGFTLPWCCRSLSLLCLLLLCGFVSDNAIHPPPTCGTYAYDSYNPSVAGFPGVGGTFLDPVFGETVTRLTAISTSQVGPSTIYNLNGRWNANNTAFIIDVLGTMLVLNPATGATIRSGVPYPSGTTGEQSFDPVNSDIYYYTDSTATLKSYSLASGTSSNVKTFASALGPLGQSSDWIDRTGDIFLLNIGGSARIWKKSTDTLYTGSVTLPSDVIPPGAGWAGLTPDGNYVVFSHATFSAYPKGSFAINHGTTTLSTTEVTFWDLGGSDHGDLVSTSDGNNYLMTAQVNCTVGGNSRSLWRVNITNNVGGTGCATTTTATGNQLLIQVLSSNTAGNGDFACGATGKYQDWCYANIADPSDTIGSNGTWYAYRQELFVVNMVTLEMRRIMHHRARPNAGYCRQVRPSASWDGTKVMFTSPFSFPDSGGCGYSDVYRYDAP